jgi:dihydroorotate dehydrogenase (fumarate)
MDLTTTYLGLRLRTPLVPSASPLSEQVDNIRQLEDAGAAAVVLYSLFEEELVHEQRMLQFHLEAHTDTFAEALSFFPAPPRHTVGPEEYLNHIHRAKAAVDIPIIASLNGSSLGGWTTFAQQIEQAGADALELNVYTIPTDPGQPGAAVEQMVLEILRAVKGAVHIPVAIKLSPFFSNMAAMAQQLDEAGADGLVLFNRFYQPDIDLETLEVWPHVLLSTPQDLRLPLRWISILDGRITADLAATGGVHDAADVVKLLLVGARVTMMASALLRHGIGHLRLVEQRLQQWLEDHEYESVRQLQGSLSQRHAPDPGAFERAQYLRALRSYRPRPQPV